ncbi:MAG TPA: methionyl-tRNA formyltransferase, partial [Candidatus Limiplasma sp.]|nr:methionyl-tRNA formyltransferase [Candidatus Limiplasma sp.]
ASLLPRHRGSAPVNWAILQGDTQTGVTTMMTDAGIDTGDMLLKREVPISDTDTAASLTLTLSIVGAELLMETIDKLKAGTCPRSKQDDADMTYDPMLKKEMGKLDFAQPSRALLNRVRAMNPWPGAYVECFNGSLKVWQAASVSGYTHAAPGTVLTADAKGGLIVACGDGAIELLEIQAPNAKRMTARAFLLGRSIQTGKTINEATL